MTKLKRSFVLVSQLYSHVSCTGRCDIESECLCSEVELDLSKALEEALKTKSIEEYVKEKIQEFQDEIASWELSEKVKSLIPSRCQVGDG